MTIGGVLSPLRRGSTYRRGIHLLLGGVILLPYVQLAVIFGTLLTDPQTSWPVGLLLLVPTVVIAAVPAFLGGTRALEITAARFLLGVDLPDQPAGPGAPGLGRETRLRAALWFAVHLIAGGVVGLALLIALPLALLFLGQLLGVGTEVLAGLRLGPLDEHDTGWLSLIGLLLLIGLGYGVAGLGALAASMAPVLLGPSPVERIAALETAAQELAERNRLARELHDSVGHALTVTTLQAGAALRLMPTDPEFVRRALTAIEETGRTAMEDLDHVLALLRETGPSASDGPSALAGSVTTGDAATGSRGPQRTLSDLDRLVADARATGLRLALEVTGDLAEVPAVASREGYRIAQEALTNAVRHANGAAVALRLTQSPETLVIEVVNPMTAKRPVVRSGGRGLAGMRERVALLGGDLVAAEEPAATGAGDVWRVRVRLPIHEERSGA